MINRPLLIRTISIGAIINTNISINMSINMSINIIINITINIDIIILISAGIFKDTYHTNLYFTSANLTISFDLSSFFSLYANTSSFTNVPFVEFKSSI